jgi:asparagine synthase (glutamine-hydrolysing)
MCGIVGIVSPEGVLKEELAEAVRSLHHRGPDDSGIYLNAAQTVGLGHTRLSFLDLSLAGHQPMSDESGSLHVVFNGEIYNFLFLKNELESLGYIFRTHSDTEVLLHGFKAWGNHLPEKLKGMFAFAIFDEKSQKLFLARDRFGIKPLYYGIFGKNVVFSSELKALFPFSKVNKKINPGAVALFLANRYIPAPQTIWENIYKLPPAHTLHYEIQNARFQVKKYWQLSIHSKQNSDFRELQFEIEFRLTESVNSHLLSDVPIGSFLSGGMDSTAIVRFMKNKVERPRTFTVGFTGWEKSEDQFARMAADALGADLHVEMLDKMDFDEFDNLSYFFDEPIADISIIPTFKVSELASRHVKAVLSGEGADECFGGYTWQQPGNFYFPDCRSELLSKLFGKRFQDIKTHYIHAMSMGLFDSEELRAAFSDEWQKAVPDDPFAHFDAFKVDGITPLKQIQFLDIHTFMSELILVKIDRASMANSLEVRVPFLDHDFVQFMFSLSEKAYFRPNAQKWVLRNMLTDKVPPLIYDRKKQGFVGPDQFYMNNNLYFENLKGGRLVNEGVIKRDYIIHLFNKKDHWRLWKLFVLERWWRKWM